jgi:hypothetical protein
MNETGLNGAFFNAGNTANTVSSDYAYIEDNRTIDKQARLVRTAILPFLGGPITYNSDGTLSTATIDYIEGLSDSAMSQMLNAGEISAYKTTINPTQNVQQTGNLIVTIQDVQTGVARNITVNIGFVASIA